MWNPEKDLCLLKEIAGEGVLQQKAKSRERGTSWLNVANKLDPRARERTLQRVKLHFALVFRSQEAHKLPSVFTTLKYFYMWFIDFLYLLF